MPTLRTIPCLVLALALVGCDRPAPAASGAPTFADAEGKPLVLTGLPAKRIVSTMQSATEWLVALGAADVLVARTDYDRQPELAALPSIGGGLDPSAEAVAALHPELVLGWQNRSSSDLQRALASFGIPVVSMETADTGDIFRHLAALGQITGRAARADSLGASLRERLRAVRTTQCAANDTTARESVFVVLWSDPPQTTGRGTWLHTIVETACLRNVFGDLDAPWPSVALEAIVARQPDWILTSAGMPGERLNDLRKLPGWSALRAVREGRILEVDGDLLSRAGPTIAAAAEAIATARRTWTAPPE